MSKKYTWLYELRLHYDLHDVIPNISAYDTWRDFSKAIDYHLENGHTVKIQHATQIDPITYADVFIH